MALFGEKYGDEVRVVTMGREPGAGNAPVYSMELCGGTHVRRTGDVGLIKVVSEGAVAAGVRRIEALAGEDAHAYLETQDRRVREVAALLKTTPDDIAARVRALVEERRRLERELADAKKKLAMGGGTGGQEAPFAEVNGIKLLARRLEGVDPKDLRGLVDQGKQKLGSGVVAFVTVSDEGKAGIVVGVTDDLKERCSAVDLVRAGAEALGGTGGGGRSDMAQAGGPNGACADAALEAVSRALGALAGAA
jgi:alanyl-tRNA synthetase